MLMPLRGSLKGEFFKAWGNLSIRWGRRRLGQRPPHRLDESPVGYSSAGWSPPELASASPTKSSILQNSPSGRKIFIAVDARFWAKTLEIIR